MLRWTDGACWRCDREHVPVTWQGPVTWDGQHAPFCVCEPCLAAIEGRAQRHFLLHRPDPDDAPATFRQQHPRVARAAAAYAAVMAAVGVLL